MVRTFYCLSENEYCNCGWITPSADSREQAEYFRSELSSKGVNVEGLDFEEPSVFINLSNFPAISGGYSESLLISDVCETIYHEFVHHTIREIMGREEYISFASEKGFFNEFITYYMTSEGGSFNGFLHYNKVHYLKYLFSPFSIVRRFFLFMRGVFSKVYNFLGFIRLLK